MGRKKKIPVTTSVENLIEEVTYRDVEFTCPIRGKVIQKVKVIKYKTQKPDIKDVTLTNDPMINSSGVEELTEAEAAEDEV